MGAGGSNRAVLGVSNRAGGSNRAVFASNRAGGSNRALFLRQIVPVGQIVPLLVRQIVPVGQIMPFLRQIVPVGQIVPFWVRQIVPVGQIVPFLVLKSRQIVLRQIVPVGQIVPQQGISQPMLEAIEVYQHLHWFCVECEDKATAGVKAVELDTDQRETHLRDVEISSNIIQGVSAKVTQELDS